MTDDTIAGPSDSTASEVAACGDSPTGAIEDVLRALPRADGNESGGLRSARGQADPEPRSQYSALEATVATSTYRPLRLFDSMAVSDAWDVSRFPATQVTATHKATVSDVQVTHHPRYRLDAVHAVAAPVQGFRR